MHTMSAAAEADAAKKPGPESKRHQGGRICRKLPLEQDNPPKDSAAPSSPPAKGEPREM